MKSLYYYLASLKRDDLQDQFFPTPYPVPPTAFVRNVAAQVFLCYLKTKKIQEKGSKWPQPPDFSARSVGAAWWVGGSLEVT